MAERRALVSIDGQIKETPTGDTIYGGGGGGGSFPLTGTQYTQTSANYTTLATDETVEITANSNTITLLNSPIQGFYQTIINTGNGLPAVQASGGGTVQGETIGYIEQFNSFTFVHKGSNVWIIK
jgi:hypothetical protein